MTRAVAVLLLLQVKQARTAAAYEKMVLRVNAWMVEQEYEPFAHTVEVKKQTKAPNFALSSFAIIIIVRAAQRC